MLPILLLLNCANITHRDDLKLTEDEDARLLIYLCGLPPTSNAYGKGRRASTKTIAVGSLLIVARRRCRRRRRRRR